MALCYNEQLLQTPLKSVRVVVLQP